MSLSPDQVEIRRLGVTATDAAAIAGVHPHRRAIDVWQEKTGQAEPFVGNERSRWGEILEGPIRQDYERRHGVIVRVVGTCRGEQRWQMATPDGIVYSHGSPTPERGLEIKVHGRSAVWWGGLEYGAPGTDEVPEHELVQCAWGMHVTELPAWDLVAFLDGAPVEYTILRDDELLGLLVERVERFYVDSVVGGNPPEPDGSSAYDEFQKRRHRGKPIRTDVVRVEPDDPVYDVIHDLRETRRIIAENEKRKRALNQRIKELIGDAAGLEFTDETGKPALLQWKRNRPGKATDWHAVAVAARERAALALSAHRPALERALLLTQRFENDEAVHDVGVAIDEAISTLATIGSSAFEEEHTEETEGNRPFTVPRSWSRTEDDDNKDKRKGN